MLYLQLSQDEITLIILAICIIPIIILMVVAIIVALRRSKKTAEQRRLDSLTSEDTTQKELFFSVFGGKENITGITHNLSRITVDVRNLDLLKDEELQELGASGVLLVGNSVKASFGDRAEYIYELMKNFENEENNE